MPTYEYECTSCNHRFDVFQSMKDDPIKICEKCSGGVRRLFSPGGGIIFKGSGFYVNDYKKKENNGKGKSTQSPVNNKTEQDKSDSSSTGSNSANTSSSSAESKSEARSA